MEKILFAPLLFKKLAQEDTLRIFFCRFLFALAAALAITVFFVFFIGWKEIFEMRPQALIGGIIYQLFLLVATYLAVHVTLIRAGEVRKGYPGQPAAFTVAVAVCKIAGEAWGFASALLGTGAGIFVWFAGREANVLLKSPAILFPFLKTASASFFTGAALIAQGLLYGALALLAGYLFAALLDGRTEERGEEK